MAQLVEHILGKDEVISSTLISSSSPGAPIGVPFFIPRQHHWMLPAEKITLGGIP